MLMVSFAFLTGYAVLAAGLYLARAVAPWQGLLLGTAPARNPHRRFAYAPKPAIVVPAIAFVVGLGSVGLPDILRTWTGQRLAR
jgi:hypothetical protein